MILLVIFFMIFICTSNQLTGEQVKTAFNQLGTAYTHLNQYVTDDWNGFEYELAKELSAHTDAEGFDQFINTVIKYHDIELVREGSTTTTTTQRRRRLGEPVAPNCDTTAGFSDYCTYVEAPYFTDGIAYPLMLAQIGVSDLSGYTSTPDYIALQLADSVASGVLIAVAAACDIGATCAGTPIPPTCNDVGCAVSAPCNIAVGVAEVAIRTLKRFIDFFDIHDGLLLGTQVQTIFDNRLRVSTNQKWIQQTFMDRFDILNKTMISNHNDTIVAFDKQDKFLQDAFDEIDAEFARITKLVIDLFNLENEWLDIKFDDLFAALNTLDKLIRTPSGKRPGWNRQTGLDSLFVKPMNISIPDVADLPTFEPTITPTHLPTILPTKPPTVNPSITPIVEPTGQPTMTPTDTPTKKPSSTPTAVTSSPTSYPIGPPDIGTNLLVYQRGVALKLTQIMSINQTVNEVSLQGNVLSWDGTNAHTEEDLIKLIKSNKYRVLIGLNPGGVTPIWSSDTTGFMEFALDQGILDRMIIFDGYTPSDIDTDVGVPGLDGFVETFQSRNAHPVNEGVPPSTGPSSIDNETDIWFAVSYTYINFSEFVTTQTEARNYYLNDCNQEILISYCLFGGVDDTGLIVYGTVPVDVYLRTLDSNGDQGKAFFTNVVDFAMEMDLSFVCNTNAPTDTPTTSSPTTATPTTVRR